jgi:hypothetical protein
MPTDHARGLGRQPLYEFIQCWPLLRTGWTLMHLLAYCSLIRRSRGRYRYEQHHVWVGCDSRYFLIRSPCYRL